MTSYPPLDVQKEVIPHFPALQASDFVYADNAGGSQILKSSVDVISNYLLTSNVQVGGGYKHSINAGKQIATASEDMALLVNCPGGPGGVVFGGSTTQCLTNLGHTMENAGVASNSGLFEANDEIIVTAADHESNVGPWTRLAKKLSLPLKYWLPTPTSSSPFSLGLDPETIVPLVTANTRLVAFTATSNLLGQFTDVKKTVELIKEKSGGHAMVIVDCVAYSPHSRIDMVKWGCDVVVFSNYKLFGPHIASMVIAPTSPIRTLDLPTLGHYFHPRSPISYMLAPGGASYELMLGAAAVVPYLKELGSVGAPPNATSNELLDIAFARIRAHEKTLSERLLGYLLSEEAKAKGVRVVGPETAEERGPTISFLVVGEEEGGLFPKRVKSADIVKIFDEKTEIGLKYGDFYAKRIPVLLPLSENAAIMVPTSSEVTLTKGQSWLPLPDPDVVVRFSLAHYNTVEQVDQIIEVLKGIL